MNKDKMNLLLSQAAEINNIGIVREMEKISSKNILNNPLYQPSLSARYQYDPGVVLKEKLLTFEEMFEKKPEKDDWQIVVNINGQETYAELRKNGSSVKSIDSIVNDFKVKNSFRRNPAYIEKPR